ncbi:MAG: HEAT repeat domain-containing protein [Planctomycetota bacterium]|jgi:HEAT repeat protein
MDDSHDKDSSGIVCVVSRQAGAVAGTSAVISKKIAGCGVKTIVAAKDCIKQPLKCFVPARDKKSSATSQTSSIKSRGKQETGRKKAAKAIIAALESDLAAAQHKLKKAQSNAEKTQSKLASQLKQLKVEKESLISDMEQVKKRAGEAAAREDEVKTRVAALETEITATQRRLEMSHKKETGDTTAQPLSDISSVQPEEETVLSTRDTEETSSQKAVEAEKPAFVGVTDEEVQAAVFANPTDKIILMRAFTDVASSDASVRVDATKMMAGIRHELSVKMLSAQMACESSVRVRQECIKALAAMEMTEALSAVENALTDEAGSVRLAAVWGLYHLAGAESAPALIRMFADNDEEVRRRAVTCIGWLGKEELVVELLPLLDDNSISVRRAAVEAMSNLRSRQVVSSLIERLNDPVESIRKVVLSAIERITGKKISKSFPKDQKELERLIERWRQWHKEQL